MSAPEVARLFVEGKQVGSAWLITAGIVVTAWHCIRHREDEKILLRWSDGSESHVCKNGIVMSQGIDIALLQLTEPVPKEVIALSPRRLRVDDRGISFGYSVSSRPDKLQTLSVRCQILSAADSRARFDFETRIKELADLHGLSGGPILVGGHVIAVNVVRGDMADQLDAICISALRRQEFIGVCGDIAALPSAEWDLAVRVRGSSIWVSSNYDLDDNRFVEHDYKVNSVSMDGTREDFGELAYQLARLFNFDPDYVRNPVEPEWIRNIAPQDLAQFCNTVSIQLDANCFDLNLNAARYNHCDRGVPRILGKYMQNCPRLDFAEIELTESSKKSLFFQRLAKARPEGAGAR